MKLFWKILLTGLSLALVGVGMAHVPILSACGVDVFALRGLLVPLSIPVVIVFSIPFALCITFFFKKKDKVKK